jgi:hypothetical protein
MLKEMVTGVTKAGRFEVAVSLHTVADPTAATWDDYCALLLDFKKRNRGDIGNLKLFVLSDGGAPNAAQRRRVHTDIFPKAVIPTSLVSASLSNPLKRGIVTAISWLNDGFKAFEPHEYRNALAHLELEPHDDLVWKQVVELAQRIPKVLTVERCAAHLGGSRELR